MKGTVKLNPQGHHWLLLMGAIALSLGPLLVLQGREFGATDANNTTAIQELHPGYQPWVEPVIQDSGPEVQAFLFAAQAGVGAGVTGYILGLYKGRSAQVQKGQVQKGQFQKSNH